MAPACSIGSVENEVKSGYDVIMKRSPMPREAVFDLYWHFAAERQRAFERRAAGEPGPWSDDPILRTFKFCNVYRATDRVSQYLIREVAYGGEACKPQDRLFQIVAFRLFSKNETWESLRRSLGRAPVLEDLADGRLLSALDKAKEQNGRLYTGAFILCATDAYHQPNKHSNHVELLKHMFLLDDLGQRLLDASSLGEVYGLLRAFPLMGDFMSYQMAVDLNYSDLINFSENDFTQPGPGAMRGIRKAFTDLGGMTPQEVILWMVERQQEEFFRLGIEFGGLWGRPLHAIDCQGLFCELDKYCREAVPELTSNRSRIKARFTPSIKPLHFFFPPKWGINGRAIGALRPAAVAQEALPF